MGNSKGKQKEAELTVKETSTTTYSEKDGNRSQQVTISNGDPSQVDNFMKKIPHQNSHGHEMGNKYGSVLTIQM